MFEVGKKYKGSNGTVYECIGVHPFRVNQQAGVMRFSGRTDNPEDKGDIPYVFAWDYSWTEFKEPVVKKKVRTVVTSQFDGGPVVLPQVFSTDTVLGVVEFTMTDGKLTEVRIIE